MKILYLDQNNIKSTMNVILYMRNKSSTAAVIPQPFVFLISKNKNTYLKNKRKARNTSCGSDQILRVSTSFFQIPLKLVWKASEMPNPQIIKHFQVPHVEHHESHRRCSLISSTGGFICRSSQFLAFLFRGFVSSWLCTPVCRRF